MNFAVGKERLYNKNFGKDKNIILWDVQNIENGQPIKIRFLKNNTNYRQGIRIAVDDGEGELEINGLKGRVMELWDDNTPNEIVCVCKAQEGKISVYNIWNERGYPESQSDSSGMVLEEKGNTLIYKCNDFGFESTFDKIIFSIEKM
ncbi:MAG: hypothetical protein F9K24_19235 [Leptonema illini]|jgi:hypothetical protein|uniref:Uncharacterized protein n=1 Tax=Leptonema illini TaxID=183 RepID=A0A833GY06_9LEPT|nr:MAG: hypothetical protein F9K24_19235 [Leptonema illini]